MKTIAHIHRDARITWDAIADPDERLLEACGDIVINLLDVWDPSPLYVSKVLERWADGWGFSLSGIRIPDAVQMMHLAFVFPTIAELVPDFAEAVDRLRGVEVDAEHLEGQLRDLLDLPIRVNGALLREFICDQFDGPFPSEQEKLGALMLRSAA